MDSWNDYMTNMQQLRAGRVKKRQCVFYRNTLIYYIAAGSSLSAAFAVTRPIRVYSSI